MEFRNQNLAGLGMALASLLLVGCTTPRPPFTDEAWVSHTTTGRGCYLRGDFRRGADAFAKAEQRAQALDDADALAVSAVNRAICLLALDRAAEAQAGLAAALVDERVTPLRRAELHVAAARTDLALGNPDAALAQADAALRLVPPPAVRGQAALAQSGAWLAKTNSARAALVLDEPLSAGGWRKLPEEIRAEHAARRAEIAAADGRPREAAVRYDEAAEFWRAAGRMPDMAHALAAAGRQYRTAADLPAACDRFWRAARSLWAQGRQPEGVRVLEEGVSCAEQLGDEAVAKRMADLFVTFRKDERLTK